MDQHEQPIPIASSSNGRVSGKPWKHQKAATVRSHLQPALKSNGFSNRMEKATKAQAIKKLQAELKDEKQAEIQKYELLNSVLLTLTVSILL
ncbi:hypothetical protein BGW80DRAFT_23291 [Lactifluus volemus]|nr:hypothetical protein BGW80DRAFT_23291 [Lactifluus volemus]